MKVTIYSLFDTRLPETVRYVGATSNPARRLGQHIDSSRIHFWGKDLWIHGLIAEGAPPNLRSIEECGKDWRSREAYWIRWHLQHGHPLLNRLHGIKTPPPPIGYPEEFRNVREIVVGRVGLFEFHRNPETGQIRMKTGVPYQWGLLHGELQESLMRKAEEIRISYRCPKIAIG